MDWSGTAILAPPGVVEDGRYVDFSKHAATK
jgi:hypothetical protein